MNCMFLFGPEKENWTTDFIINFVSWRINLSRFKFNNLEAKRNKNNQTEKSFYCNNT